MLKGAVINEGQFKPNPLARLAQGLFSPPIANPRLIFDMKAGNC